MKVSLWKCDKCAKEFRDNPEPVRFVTGKQTDPASGRNEEVISCSDLCSVCRGRLLQYLINLYPDQCRLANLWGAQ